MNELKEEKRFVGVKNWIGKMILMVFGTIWLASDLYDNVMSNFLLTDKLVDKWGTTGDYGVAFVSTGFILGGYYLNTIFDFVKSKLSK